MPLEISFPSYQNRRFVFLADAELQKVTSQGDRGNVRRLKSLLREKANLVGMTIDVNGRFKVKKIENAGQGPSWHWFEQVEDGEPLSWPLAA